LDAEILRVIDAWHRNGQDLTDADFDDLALRLFIYQICYNEPYARYCASLGFSAQTPPASWKAIPAVPTEAFKEATLTTFDPAGAVLAFETSGTMHARSGRHYMETRALYDGALLAGFDRFMRPDNARLRYLNLVPNPADRPQSSLGYMMAKVSAERGDGQTGWYLRGDDFFFETLITDIRTAIADNAPVCLAGTAFAFVHVCDELATRGLLFALPVGSRAMETGGFKGRSRVVARADLHASIATSFGIALDRIVGEYGMTELTSQWYDTGRDMHAPPWLRARVVGADGNELPDGIVGALVHVDLANRSSCLAIHTEDLGARTDGGGLVVIGREQGAELRGCSLDAESLRARTAR
jgi:hypothetical protein